MEFNPMARKNEISGVGGILGCDGFSSAVCFFASWRLRFLLLFPLDFVRWFARCWPTGESRLHNRTRRLSTTSTRFQRRERIGRLTCREALVWFLGLVMTLAACNGSASASQQRGDRAQTMRPR